MGRSSISASSAILASAVGMGSVLILLKFGRKTRDEDGVNDGEGGDTAYEQLIERGTPIVRLRRVSKILGRSIYVKMESLNPGGTGKDRAAISMIRHAEASGLLPPPVTSTTGETRNRRMSLTFDDSSSTISQKDSGLWEKIKLAMVKSRSGGLFVEGTSGSTGISLATLCAARGHAIFIVMPDDQSVEKQKILRALGAFLYVVPTASISNPNHYVNIAKKAAELARSKGIQAVFGNQFENIANYEVHYSMTGPEIYRQCPHLDAFVMSSGTGGTISGVGNFLKEQNQRIRITLVDPPGSSLYNKVEHGVAYASEQQERTLRRHRYDTVAEGIGLDRITNNFNLGLESIDNAIRVSDQEAVDMAHWLMKTEGLWVGSSSAMNVVGAIRTAIDLPSGSTIVTMICDSGQRHSTRFWNRDFVEEWGLTWPSEQNNIPECLKGILTS